MRLRVASNNRLQRPALRAALNRSGSCHGPWRTRAS
jgi:hypothetical protein